MEQLAENEVAQSAQRARWSAGKTCLILFLPSIIFLAFGLLGVLADDVFLSGSLFLAPIVAIICVVLATREFGSRADADKRVGSFILFSIVWLIAHMAMIFFVGFCGCMMIAGALGENLLH